MRKKLLAALALMLAALLFTTVTAFADIVDLPPELIEESESSAADEASESGMEALPDSTAQDESAVGGQVPEEEKSVVETSGGMPTATFIAGASALVVVAAALWFIVRGAKRSGRTQNNGRA